MRYALAIYCNILLHIAFCPQPLGVLRIHSLPSCLFAMPSIVALFRDNSTTKWYHAHAVICIIHIRSFTMWWTPTPRSLSIPIMMLSPVGNELIYLRNDLNDGFFSLLNFPQSYPCVTIIFKISTFTHFLNWLNTHHGLDGAFPSTS